MQPTFLEQQRFAGSVGFARGYVRAVQAIPGHELRLLDLHDQLVQAANTGAAFLALLRADLNTAEHDERTLQEWLAGLSDLRVALDDLLAARAPLLLRHPDCSAYWPEALHDRLEVLAEHLEDLEEAIALGVSPAVRAEVEAARHDARRTA